MMIMAALAAVVIAFIHAAEDASVNSMSHAYINLAGRSVLSEFNICLKEDYNIFAIGLQEAQISKRMRFYLDHNLPVHGFVKMKVDSMQINVNDYSLASVENFQQQVLEAGEYILGKTRDKSQSDQKNPPDRILRNEVILNNLPSSGFSSGLFNFDLISGNASNIKDLIKGASDKVITNEYILYYFKYGDGSNIFSSSFFQKEVEYILYGNKSDAENGSRMKRDFIILRTLLNLAHIKSDPKKMEELAFAAALLTPGPEVLATQLILAGIWAALEAENDWKLISNGYGVAFIKAGGDWALDISAITDKPKEKSYIKPEKQSSFSYADYLRVLLYFEKNEVKLLRMMDLIQINMIGRNDKNFLIKEHYVGFNLDISINGKRFHYDEYY